MTTETDWLEDAVVAEATAEQHGAEVSVGAGTLEEATEAEAGERAGAVAGDDPEGTVEATEEAEAALGVKPDDVPEKFWDAEAGQVRTEALLRSYRELEKRISRSVTLPTEGAPDEALKARLFEVLGRPQSPEAYEVETGSPLIEVDAEVNARLHAAGFTQEQAALVYELASERLLPAMAEAAEDLAATREAQKLEARFGAETWPRLAEQLGSWGKSNLKPEVYDALSSSAEGVLAMHEMMRKAEPELVGRGGEPVKLDQGSLREMMRDPRYWRERDPKFVARVTDGYKRLFG